MPRIFSVKDKTAIREALIDAGAERFRRYGLRRTNVEELARAAGIAKGTFYHFFPSKEDLCMEIFDREERAAAGRIESILASHRDPRETVRSLLAYAVQFARSESLLTALQETGEYAVLARGVGRELLSRHLDRDVELGRRLLDDLRAKGAECAVEPELLAGVFRAMVLLTLHEGEVGSKIFDRVMEKLVEWTASGITGEGKR